MRANDRLNEIVKILNKQGRVHVKDLSQMFDVSEDLIRKDLKKLEEQDLIDRIYGGAERKTKKFDVSNIKYRMNLHQKSKQAIAMKALEEIENGETIFLDTSSTCATIAQALAQSNKELTVITNMLEIVRLLESNNDIRVILLGGLYNRQIGGFVGYEVIEQIKGYFVDKAFITCMAFDKKRGVLMSSTKDIGFTKKAMLDYARKGYYVGETRKFKMAGTIQFYEVKDLHGLIFEKELNDVEKADFKDMDLIIR